jgi:hypothetical protein
MNDNLIKTETNVKSDDLRILRENFIIQYAKNKGWDHKNLTSEQLLEIVENKKYKNPMILS